jgi:hypothetical protein
MHVYVYTLNSTYEFHVRAWDTTVRGGIVGKDRTSCVPADEVVDLALGNIAANDLVGKPLHFRINDGGTYTDPNWVPVRTSLVRQVAVNTLPLAA